jgi:E3 SUMO-protein ligase NSE2
MSRRLFRGGARVANQPARSAPADDDADIAYEPLSFPLSETARNQLGELSRSRNTLAYQNQLKEALRNLGHSVYDLNDRLQSQRARLEAMRARREERGTEKTAEEERTEAHVVDLQRQVDELARKSEAAVRHTIDQRAQLEDNAAVLGELYTRLASARGNDNIDGTDQGESKPIPAESAIDALRELKDEKLAAYRNMPPYERYSVDNDYAAFKKLWHDSLFGDDGIPLTDPSRWFRPDGTPVLSTTAASGPGNGAAIGAEGDGEESDEDLAIAREVLSLKCPLTLRPFEEPYSNHKCKHTFEKSAILDYLRGGRGNMQCPQTGCSEVRNDAREKQPCCALGPP